MSMDSLTIHYVARELDARWRGRRVHGCVLDRETRTVTVAVDGVPPVCVDLSVPDVRVWEGESDPADGVLAGWTIAEVAAPTDDRRLVVRFERPGKFRGSRARRVVLQLSVVPTARGALLTDDGGHRLASVGAKLPASAEPRAPLTAEELERAVARHEPDSLLGGRWMSPRLARWLVSLGAGRASDAYAEQ
jgi:hypothetical protein